MTTVLRYAKGHQFIDPNGLPVTAGQLQYFITNTTTALVTTSDSAGATPNTLTSGYIVLDGAGRLLQDVYIGSGNNADEYLYYSSGLGGGIVSPWPATGIQAPISYTAPQLGFAPPLTATLAINQSESPYTLSVAQLGALVIGSTASGALIINLPPAANATPGQGYWIQKPIGVNNLTLTPNGSDLIEGFSSYAITRVQSLMLVSDGATWHMPFDTGGAVGTVSWYAASSTPPADCLTCDGTPVSRTTYARLFQAIGTTYGTGDGSTTFNLPLLTGYFVRGFDTLGTVDPSRVFGSTQADAFALHGHAYMGFGYTGSGGLSSSAGSGCLMITSNGYNTVYGPYTGTPTSTAGQLIGGSGGTETRPKNIALLPIVKF